MLKPCWVTFTFLGFQSVRGDIHESQNDSSNTVTFQKIIIQQYYTLLTRFADKVFWLQQQFTRYKNTEKLLIIQYETAILFKQKKNKGKSSKSMILNALTSFPDSNMPGLNAFCKLNSFVMIPSPLSSFYEKQRSISLNITFLSETKGITPGTAYREKKLKPVLNIFTWNKQVCSALLPMAQWSLLTDRLEYTLSKFYREKNPQQDKYQQFTSKGTSSFSPYSASTKELIQISSLYLQWELLSNCKKFNLICCYLILDVLLYICLQTAVFKL